MPAPETTKGNILLVANWESNVGYAWWLMENFWTAIADHFREQQQQSFLIYPKITLIPDTINSADIKISELNFSDNSFKNLLRIRQLIKNNEIKNIYLSDYPAYSWLYLLLRTFGIKKIVVHDHTPGERTRPGSIKKTIKKLIQGIPYYTADHFIAVTDFVYRRHIEVNCIPLHKCSVASNGIHSINMQNIDSHYAQSQFNIPKERNIVVTTGRASYYKGIDFFIECANELINNQGIEQLHFLFCGDGPDIEQFKQLCGRLNVNDYFTFAGKRNDIDKILPSCKIGFHCATGEVGYSLSILEYMRAGLATIVPDNPSTSLSITDMEDGILYRPRDLQAATEAIKKSLDPIFSEMLSQNAITTVKNRYHIGNTKIQLIDILQPIFSNGKNNN